MKHILSCLLLILSCTPASVQPTPEPQRPEPEPVVESCETACRTLKILGCDEADPIVSRHSCNSDDDCESDGVCSAGTCVTTCEVFCEKTQALGVLLDVGCVTNVSSCEQVKECDGLK